jgi:hypothetical protein
MIIVHRKVFCFEKEKDRLVKQVSKKLPVYFQMVNEYLVLSSGLRNPYLKPERKNRIRIPQGADIVGKESFRSGTIYISVTLDYNWEVKFEEKGLGLKNTVKNQINPSGHLDRLQIVGVNQTPKRGDT